MSEQLKPASFTMTETDRELLRQLSLRSGGASASSIVRRLIHKEAAALGITLVAVPNGHLAVTAATLAAE